MYNTAMSAYVDGLDVVFVSVEADVRNGLPSFQMVGYLSAEVKEAGERVRAAILNSGYAMQPMKILVNLSPADVRKRGTAFDLSVAAAILASLNLIPDEKMKRTVILGELTLNGEVRGVPGVLPVVMEAQKNGYEICIVPEENRREAELIDGIRICGVQSLQEMADILKGKDCGGRESDDPKRVGGGQKKKNPETDRKNMDQKNDTEDYRDIYGQEAVKRAIEIAVAGGHNLLMIGPPGSGKSMMASRIPTILPPMDMEECLEVSKIYSIRGLLDSERPWIADRPFRAVHHSVTRTALIGGGRNPMPGEISLASGGVLFLDELPEMERTTVEALRQPLEERKIHITRSRGTYCYPADFLLVCAMNPCPCGNYPDLNRCSCTASEINRYLSRVSRPFLERIEVCIEVPDVSYQEIREKKIGKSSGEMRSGIMRAREIQKKRYCQESFELNAQLCGTGMDRYCCLDAQEEQFMERIFNKLHLSVRTYHSILKVARTIADLDESEEILMHHLQEAAGYRMTDLKGEMAHGVRI